MRNKVCGIKRICPLMWVLLISISVVELRGAFFVGYAPQRNSSESEERVGPSERRMIPQVVLPLNPWDYLPAGAKIKDPNKDVVLADLDGDGPAEVIIFYTLGETPDDHKANVLVLKRKGGEYVWFWEDVYEGSWGFADPTGVFDVTKSGRPQIVIFRTIGASCYGAFDIYEYREGAIKAVVGDWGARDVCREVALKDIDGDGLPEIVIEGRKAHGELDEIYRWNGKRYVRSDNEYPHYYNSALEDLLIAIRSPEPLPVSAREMWGRQALRIYQLQRRFSQAIELGQELLRIIEDPQLTVPSSRVKGDEPAEVLQRIRALFEVEKLQGKAAIYRLLGDMYKAGGRSEQAEEHYRKADELETEAKEKRSKPPH